MFALLPNYAVKPSKTILDTSKNPYPAIHQGEGYQDNPRDVKTGTDRSVNASDVVSTIADPTAAFENAPK